jgi:large subunit ribosomal protein L31
MKDKIHPSYNKVKVICTSCGNEFESGSTLKEIRVDSCSKCHPFFTGKLRFGTAAGRSEKFLHKYNMTLDDSEKK